MQVYIEIEVYDDNAAGQDDEGCWPTKRLYISKPWLDEYAKSATCYNSANELLTNYTYDENCRGPYIEKSNKKWPRAHPL